MTKKTTSDISQEHLRIIAGIAKDSVFEPFEGSTALERIQNTQQKLKTKYEGLKETFGEYYEKSKKLGKEQYASLKTQTEKYFPEEKNSLDKYIPETAKQKLKSLWKSGLNTIKGISERTLKALREKTIEYIQDTFRILVKQNGEEWIVGVAREALKRDDILKFEDIQNLNFEERRILLSLHYPQSNNLLKKHSEKFDYAVNLLLGTVVTTNLPFTGAVVCLINIAKTIVRVANRIHCLSQIYGCKIPSEANLYSLAAKILKSMNDWDTNPAHRPLSPSVIGDFYEIREEQDFEELLKEIIIRDHYIAIPLVGSVSLAKLNFDDFKTDVYVESLFHRHFAEKEMKQKFGEEKFMEIFSNFQSIFEKQKNLKTLEKIKKNHLRDKALSSEKSRFELLKVDKEDLKLIHDSLIDEALETYTEQNNLEQK